MPALRKVNGPLPTWEVMQGNQRMGFLRKFQTGYVLHLPGYNLGGKVNPHKRGFETKDAALQAANRVAKGQYVGD